MRKSTKALCMAFLTYLLIEEPKLMNGILKATMEVINKKEKSIVPEEVKE